MVLRAENSQGTSESAADVTIQPKPGPPYFSREPQDHEVMDGEESVKFSAIVHGNPEPVVYWSVPGRGGGREEAADCGFRIAGT